MKIYNKGTTVRDIIFSKTFTLVYFVIGGFFLYKSYHLYPIWFHHYKKNVEIKNELEEKRRQIKEAEEKQESRESDLWRLRYEKDFFNKLDEGEEMIILYGTHGESGGGVMTTDNTPNNKPRHLFFWEKWYLDFLVWWRNI